MFELAYIQEEGNGQLAQESRLVREHCQDIGLPVKLYLPKHISRRNLPLGRATFICGDVDCLHGAMRQLKIPVPEAVYYPDSLRAYLHRRIWSGSVGGLRERIEQGHPPVFAKPAGRAKVFTGRVFESFDDLRFLGRTSEREEVCYSEVVTWLSEFRVYVRGEDILSVDHYDGDASFTPDPDVVRQALADYRRAGEAPAAYGIDFGVLENGETALIEANDGYALGAYHIASRPYTELLFSRWAQLLASMGSNPET